MMEEWRDIEGYEGKYQVSNTGNVKSLDRIEKWGSFQRPRRGRILRNRIDKYGYNTVILLSDGMHKHFTVHKLVGMCFLTKGERDSQINHKNGIKTDNSVDNLEWCTAQDNVLHAIENGLRKKRFGSENDKSIPVIAIKDTSIIEFSCFRECAEYVGVSVASIWAACKRNSKSKGYNIYKL